MLGLRHRSGAQHPGADGARRAGDPPRHLQGACSRRPAAVAFNTEVEKNFLKTTFEIPRRRRRDRRLRRRPAAGRRGAAATIRSREDDEELHKRLAPHLRARGAQFRRRHRLQGQFLLYGGRIDAGKGCEELLEYFTSYKEQGGDAQLALMGVKLMQLPEVPWVRFAGLLSERERLQALEAATIVVVPSPFESLSLLALEAMAVGTPVLCNARAEVLVEHCLKSNAGLFYQDRDEFVECAKLLLADERLRDRMGRNGKEYVKRNYRWDVIMSKYDRLIGSCAGSQSQESKLRVDSSVEVADSRC